MKRLLQGILLLTLFTACQKQDMASKEQNKEAIHASSSANASAYAQSKMSAEIFNSYNWEQQVPLKRHDTVIAVKVMRFGNTTEKLGYLLVHNTKNGWGDIVQHEITYAIRDGKAQPQSITSTSLISKRTGTKKIVPASDGAQTGRSGTEKKSLVSPGGTLPMVTIYGTYSDEGNILTSPRNYNSTLGGLESEGGGGGYTDEGGYYDASGNFIYCDMVDPLYTPDAGGGNADLLPFYSWDDADVIDGILYTRDKYPYKDWGYEWAWWRDIISDEPESGTLNEYDPNFEWWEQNPSTRGQTFPKQARPKFDLVYSKYPMKEVGPGKVDDMTPAEIAEKLKGQIKAEFLGNSKLNFCCIRISMALNEAGIEIPEVKDNTWKDKDGKNYIRGVTFLLQFLNETFGEPEMHYTSSQASGSNLNMPTILGGIKNKGIYVMLPKDGVAFGAAGHATLWGGYNCIGGNNFFGAASQVFIWRLPQ